MHPFRFRLEVLLKYRRMQEEQAQIKLAQATADYVRKQETLADYKNRLGSQADFIRRRRQETIDVATLKMLQNYYDKISEDVRNQQESVAKAETYRRECISALEETAKARKLVEKLREKRLLQYQTEVLHEEQKHLDELGLNVFTRQN